MGTIHYGDIEATIDDATLAHLSAVAVAKLRRREPFLLTLTTPVSREAIWIHPSCTLRFSYEGAADIVLDRDRLTEMVAQTNRAGGLIVACAIAEVPESTEAPTSLPGRAPSGRSTTEPMAVAA